MTANKRVQAGGITVFWHAGCAREALATGNVSALKDQAY